EKLQKVMSAFGKKILLTYGGGSIKKIPAFRGKAGSLYDYYSRLRRTRADAGSTPSAKSL
ncbi:MAG: hypothetical protein IKQ18_02250, partial [Clostridia bacterium]|nr:hypothetical protein [Clostridia bacterium]